MPPGEYSTRFWGRIGASFVTIGEGRVECCRRGGEVPDSAEAQYCVVINSIGSASPNEVGAVAKGLGLSAEETIKSVYRAPVILAEKLEKTVASQLTGMLAKLGFDSSVSNDAGVHLAPKALFDVVM